MGGKGNQIADLCGLESKPETTKLSCRSYLCFIDYNNAFDCVILWNKVRELEMPERPIDHHHATSIHGVRSRRMTEHDKRNSLVLSKASM